MSKVTLKPCPKCDCDKADTDKHRSFWAVECMHCGYFAAACNTEAEAIAAWNVRTADDVVPVGFLEAADDWNEALAGRPYSLADWNSLTFGDQWRYAAEAQGAKPVKGEAIFTIRVGGRQSQMQTQANGIAPNRALKFAIEVLQAEAVDAANCPVHTRPADDVLDALEKPWSWPCGRGSRLPVSGAMPWPDMRLIFPPSRRIK